MFVSHCLLNENVRLPGGATCPGASPAVGAGAALADRHGERDRRSTNRGVVATDVASGRGLFVSCLDRALRSRGLTVTYREHDLITERRDAGAIAP